MSAMGMEMPMVIHMKNPNKIRTSVSFNGQEMLQVFDGTAGYMTNPMTGSTQPMELTGEQLQQIQNSNFFSNQLLNYYNNKQVALEGSEDVNGSPAFKLKVTVPELLQHPIYMFIDKRTGLITKSSTVVEQMGMTMNAETFMSDYEDVNGVVFPKKTSVRVKVITDGPMPFGQTDGMEASALIYDQIEINVPMDDSLFTIK
jgi:hypothetical protein